MAINEAKTVQIYLPTDEDTFFLRQQDHVYEAYRNS